MKAKRPSAYPQPQVSRRYPAAVPAPMVRAGRPPRARRRTLFTPQNILRLALILGVLALFAVPLLFVSAFFGYYQLSERILPGVAVGGTLLGGKTVTQAATTLEVEWNQSRLLTLSDGAGAWELAASDLGLSIGPLATAREAYRVGHDQNLAAEVEQMVYSLRNGWGVAPVLHFDPQAARAALEALSMQTGLPPKNASLQVQDGVLTAIPAEVGYTINVDETLQAVAADPLQVLLSGQLRLKLMPVIPEVEDHEIEAVMAEAEAFLSRPLALQAYDPVYDERLEIPVPRPAVASWLTVQTGEDGLPQIGLDEGRLAASIAALDTGLDAGRWLDPASFEGSLVEAVEQGRPLTFLVRHRPTSYIVQSGDTLISIGWKVGMPYWMILQANPGLDPDALYAGQQLTVPAKDDLLPLPVVTNKRIRISIREQRMWLYQDGQQIAERVISTGIDRSPTQPGVFQVQTHEPNAFASVWDLYMPNFLGIYEAWPGFMNGIHGLPTLSNGRRLWANILGRPASYGCIILDLDDAEHLYTWAENGVVVEILP